MDSSVPIRRSAEPRGLSLVELVVGLALVLVLASLAGIAGRALEIPGSA